MVTLGSPLVMPDLPAIARVDGPDIVWRRKIEDAVDFERRGLENRAMRAKNPGQRERVHVSGVDLIEGAVAGSGIVAVVGGPGVGSGLEQRCGVKALGCCECGDEGQR